MAKNTTNRGFAAMDEDKQKAIASKGGKARSSSFKSDPQRTSKRSSARGGNFKNDPQRASEAGRKGGNQ